MYETKKLSSGLINSQFYFVQPVNPNTLENPVYKYLNIKHLNGSTNTTLKKPRSIKTIKTCDSCINPVCLTNQGFEFCPCGKNTENFQHAGSNNGSRKTECVAKNQSAINKVEKNIDVVSAVDTKVSVFNIGSSIPHITKSSSFDCDYGENYKRDNRRVSILVDELLLKIYGDRDRKFSSGGTDIRDTIDYSTDSSTNFVINKNTVLLRKKRSFTGLPEDICKKWNDLLKARLMSKSLSELRTLKETLQYNISHTGSQLIRQLKRRDLLFSRRDAQCDIITAFLQAKSAKRSNCFIII